MLDLAIIIPELVKYGGAERVVIECLARWQHHHRITLYATSIDYKVVREFCPEIRFTFVQLSPYFQGEHAFFLNGTLLPKLWQQEIGTHDLYHTHLWPCHLIDRHPMVWYPHEPPRMLEDLRLSQFPEANPSDVWKVHVYPKFTYDDVPSRVYEATLNSVAMFDKLGKPDRIVANSHYVAQYLLQVYGRIVDDIVYPGVVCANQIVEISLHVQFLAVGQLWPHKRVKMIIEALAMVPDARLVIVGNGPEREKLERMALSLRIQDRVCFKHELSAEELRAEYNSCRAVVFAAAREPFGIVPLEALAHGRPLIAVNEGGYTEVVDSHCAMLVPPRPQDLADKMNLLARDIDLARAMGEAGWRKAQQYSWNNSANQLIKIIESTFNTYAHDHKRCNGGTAIDRPLIGVQYYCWYGDGAGSLHWNDNLEFGAVDDMPEIGFYSSLDGDALKYHLQLMDRNGVDFLVANLHIDSNGVNDLELAGLLRLFHVAEILESPIRIAIQLCPYDLSHDSLDRAIATLNEMSKSPHYFRFESQPVIFMFWTGAWDGQRDEIENLKAATDGFLRIACSLRLPSDTESLYQTFGLFDSWSLFSPLEVASSENWQRVWAEAYRRSDCGNRGIRSVTVSPGYDDRHLSDLRRDNNLFRFIDRNCGKTLDAMTEFVLRQSDMPQMVLVSTFNEYHENSHIEPTKRHGLQYMEAIKDFGKALRSQWM
ncbi:glycosyltransferase [Microcoleus sp.]|uniref:glycosyltransferase n=1 Tax=Microcoleus sp. TaxID=44472 RepID=UPI0035267C48